MKKISIITPFYNEEKAVEKFVLELTKCLSLIKGYDFEVLWIDDGSVDDTLKLLKEQQKKVKECNIITFSKNFGHEAAINAGINNCKGDAAIIMDSDLQDPPSLINDLIKKYEQGYDVVNVKRIDRSQDSFFKRSTAKLFYKIMSKWSYKIKVEENVNNFRLISRKIIDVVKNLTEKNKVFRFQIPFAGFKTTFIEMVRPKRDYGKSHYSIKSMNKLALDSLISISIEPLNLISKIFVSVFIIFFLSFISELVLFIIQNTTTNLLTITSISYFVWLIINILLFLSCLILLSIAIIAQYIARIHLETQNRPTYIIAEIINGKETKK